MRQMNIVLRDGEPNPALETIYKPLWNLADSKSPVAKPLRIYYRLWLPENTGLE